MTLPVNRDEGAERWLGPSSLELARARLKETILGNPELTAYDRRRIFKELDGLMEYERQRRRRLAAFQREREDQEHRLAQVRKVAEAVYDLRLQRARLDNEVAKYAKESAQCKLDVIERVLELRAKYRPATKPSAHLEELLQLKKRQRLAEAREQAILDSITKRAEHRAAFVKMVNEKFPDMADELLDYYDQQVFQQGTRR